MNMEQMYNAVIQFALTTDEGLTFLRLWNTGEFQTIREEWPDAPAIIYEADPAVKKLSLSELPELRLKVGKLYLTQEQRVVNIVSEDVSLGQFRFASSVGHLYSEEGERSFYSNDGKHYPSFDSSPDLLYPALKLKAAWKPDCCGKEDYDFVVVSVSSRFYPAGGSTMRFDAACCSPSGKHADGSGPSAVSSILIGNPETAEYFSLVRKEFSAPTPEEVKLQVEVWAHSMSDKITHLLATNQ